MYDNRSDVSTMSKKEARAAVETWRSRFDSIERSRQAWKDSCESWMDTGHELAGRVTALEAEKAELETAGDAMQAAAVNGLVLLSALITTVSNQRVIEAARLEDLDDQMKFAAAGVRQDRIELIDRIMAKALELDAWWQELAADPDFDVYEFLEAHLGDLIDPEAQVGEATDEPRVEVQGGTVVNGPLFGADFKWDVDFAALLDQGFIDGVLNGESIFGGDLAPVPMRLVVGYTPPVVPRDG